MTAAEVTTTGAGRSVPREFSLVVPAGWFCVPLLDDDERRRSLDALVEECFRGVDDQPLLKRQTRQTVSDHTRRAVACGGVQLYLALNTVNGVPLAASLLVSLTTRVAATAAGAASDELTAHLGGRGLRGGSARRELGSRRAWAGNSAVGGQIERWQVAVGDRVG